MAGIIILSGQESASNADILQGTRLQTVPQGGYLTFEIQASDNVAANNYVASIQLPGGDTPMESVLVPGGRDVGLAGVLNENDKLMATFPVAQGGHVVFGAVETGDAELTWRITYTPAG